MVSRITHTDMAMIPTNIPASAVKMLAAVKLVYITIKVCIIHGPQVAGSQTLASGPPSESWSWMLASDR